jgi:hypothetical protein
MEQPAWAQGPRGAGGRATRTGRDERESPPPVPGDHTAGRTETRQRPQDREGGLADRHVSGHGPASHPRSSARGCRARASPGPAPRECRPDSDRVPQHAAGAADTHRLERGERAGVGHVITVGPSSSGRNGQPRAIIAGDCPDFAHDGEALEVNCSLRSPASFTSGIPGGRGAHACAAKRLARAQSMTGVD